MTTERTMTPLAIAIVLSLVVGGAGGFALGGGFSGKSEQVTDVTIKTDAPDTVEAVGGVVEAAVAEDLTDAQTRQIIASSDVKVLGMQYLVDHGADHGLVGAITVYDIAAGAAQGEGSASVNVEEAQQDVSRMLACPVCPVCGDADLPAVVVD